HGLPLESSPGSPAGQTAGGCHHAPQTFGLLRLTATDCTITCERHDGAAASPYRRSSRVDIVLHDPRRARQASGLPAGGTFRLPPRGVARLPGCQVARFGAEDKVARCGCGVRAEGAGNSAGCHSERVSDRHGTARVPSMLVQRLTKWLTNLLARLGTRWRW